MARGIYKRTLLVNSSKRAFIDAINNFNNISNSYRSESALILMSNAIELLSKAVLLKLGSSVTDPRDRSKTISAEQSVWKIYNDHKKIGDIEQQAIQQLISLRNEASHDVLPEIHTDVLHYLMFSSYQTYKKLFITQFRGHDDLFKASLLSISTDSNLTYADSIEGLLKVGKKSEKQRRLLYLLERGVAYSGTQYIAQDDFEKQFKQSSNRRLINRGALGSFLSRAELLKVVFVQAPKNHTINVDIAKGGSTQREALPVFVKKTDINKDYPYILTTLAEKLGIGRHVVLNKITELNMKGNDKYHQAVQVSRQHYVQKYSDAAYQFLKDKFKV
ncbi:MAG: hypothetical protein E6Q06_04580 [Candidatus Moraniibacteriota bacterium]|nr:MAG: hypothetical protein E6Q06_04580 [Candidatus Moranbacteria bacterium]